MKQNLLFHGRDIEKHPLLKHISRVNRKSLLPKYVIGDSDRLQQVLVNLIQNSITYSMPNGKVFVNFSYNYTQKQIICIVNDTGIGIKP